MTECWSCSINAHCEDLLYYFFYISCMFKIFCYKKKNENKAEICNNYLLSGVSSFWDNAIYSLHNPTSPDLQSS